MNANSFSGNCFLLTVCALLLSSCSGQSNWVALYSDGKKASDSNHLLDAEQKFRAAIADGEIHRIPEKTYACAIADLGRVLLREQKSDAAAPFLIRALQLGSATNMSLTENIELLHKLSHAEADNENWEEALSTEKVLITLLEVEKSPLTPELKEETEFRDKLAIKLADYRNTHPHISLSEDGTVKTE